MDSFDTIQILGTLLPSLITGAVAFYFFKLHLKNETHRRNFQLLKAEKKQSLPLRLQAYERIALFLERSNPNQLLVRIKPLSKDKAAYCSLLLKTIEQEFEHNLTQQIYISEATWNIVVSSKNATIQLLHEIGTDDGILESQDLREALLKKGLKTPPPSAVALSALKNEVLQLL